MVEMLDECFRPLANPPVVHWVIGLSLEMDNFPVFNRCHHTALQPATKAEGSLDFSPIFFSHGLISQQVSILNVARFFDDLKGLFEYCGV
jgi:hypothetical protein